MITSVASFLLESADSAELNQMRSDRRKNSCLFVLTAPNGIGDDHMMISIHQIGIIHQILSVRPDYTQFSAGSALMQSKCPWFEVGGIRRAMFQFRVAGYRPASRREARSAVGEPSWSCLGSQSHATVLPPAGRHGQL